MYSDWKIVSWDTPIQKARDLRMLSLLDNPQSNELTLVVEDENNQKYSVIFYKAAAYQNILEEYRIELWDHLDKTHQRSGNTFIVSNSPWLASLKKSEPLIDAHHNEIIHYVISTCDDVIEVLCSTEPVIKLL